TSATTPMRIAVVRGIALRAAPTVPSHARPSRIVVNVRIAGRPARGQLQRWMSYTRRASIALLAIVSSRATVARSDDLGELADAALADARAIDREGLPDVVVEVGIGVRPFRAPPSSVARAAGSLAPTERDVRALTYDARVGLYLTSALRVAVEFVA